MQPKDFQTELNNYFNGLLAEFDDRMYYGGMQVMDSAPFVCNEFMSCVSSEIILGWEDMPDMTIVLVNNQIFVNDLSDGRMSLRFETNVSPRIEMRNLTPQQREEIALVRSILPSQISCDFATVAYGSQSKIIKESECEILTPSAFYKIGLEMEAKSPIYAHVSIPNLLMSKQTKEQVYQNMLSLNAFSIHITSNGLSERVFELLSRSKYGRLLSKESYEAAYPTAIPLALQNFSTAETKEILDRVANGVVRLLRDEHKNFAISLKAKQVGVYFSEAEIEEFGYLFSENPKELLRQTVQKYYVNIETY